MSLYTNMTSHTQCGLIFGYVGVGSDSLVLSVYQHPQTDLIVGVVEMLRYSCLENTVGLGLEHAERRQF